MTENTDAIAAALRQIGRGFLELADAVSGNVSSKDREVAALREFPESPEDGLSRAQASAAFKKHGLNPRAIGSWVQYGYLDREGDRRWLTAKGRARIESYSDSQGRE